MTRPSLKILRVTDPAGEPAKARRITLTEVRRIVSRLLADNVLCSMATVTAQGYAHINSAYFCYSPALELYFISHPNALHCQNLLNNPSMAIAVFSSRQAWGGADCGLQLFGTCKQSTEQEAIKADKLYGRRFVKYRAWKSSLTSDSLGSDFQFYRFATVELKVFDEKELGAAFFVLAKVQQTH